MSGHPPMEPYILTATGKSFWFDDPKPEQICIEDIAWALSQLCRYTGHCRYFYSVAQHCFLASYQVPARFALEALLHDAAEAYICDVNAPLKGMPEMAGYKAIEARVEKVIAAKFGIGFPLSPTVKNCDMRMLHTEYPQLMPKDEKTWPSFVDAPPYALQITPFTPEFAREAYVARFIELTRQEKAA